MKNSQKKMKSEKKRILEGLDTAYQNVMTEQDLYRKQMASITSQDGNVRLKLNQLGVQGVIDLMDGIAWTPTWEDRKKYLNQSWNEIPSQIRIDKIQDKDIGFQVHMLNEVVEHTARIHAMSVFRLGLDAGEKDPYACVVFHYWEEGSVCRQLAAELTAIQTDKHKELITKSELAEDTIDILTRSFENDWMITS